MEFDEPTLIKAAKNGDPESFGTIVKMYMPKALGFATQMTGSADDAQDLVQEAFVRAYKALGSYRREAGFKTWFFRVLSNVCLDHLRKSKFKRIFFFATPSAAEDGPNPVEQAADIRPASRPDADVEQRELKRALEKSLKRLSDRQRAVFLMKNFEGMKISEIAAALNITEGAVKSHLVRAVTALRKSMEDYKSHVHE